MPSEWPIRPLLWVLCAVTSAVLWVAEFSALLSAWPAALLLLLSCAVCACWPDPAVKLALELFKCGPDCWYEPCAAAGWELVGADCALSAKASAYKMIS